MSNKHSILFTFKNLSEKHQIYSIAMLIFNALLTCLAFYGFYLPQHQKIHQLQHVISSLSKEETYLTDNLKQLQAKKYFWQTYLQQNSYTKTNNDELNIKINISDIMQNLVELINASNLNLVFLEPKINQTQEIIKQKNLNSKTNSNISKTNNNDNNNTKNLVNLPYASIKLHTQGSYQQITNFLTLINQVNGLNFFILQIENFNISLLNRDNDSDLDFIINLNILTNPNYHNANENNNDQQDATNKTSQQIQTLITKYKKLANKQQISQNPFNNLANSNINIPLTTWNIKDLHYLGFIKDENQNNIAIVSDALNNIHYVKNNDKIGNPPNFVKQITPNALINTNSKYNLYRET